MKRSAFLPVFFAGLIAVVGVVAWMRLSAFDGPALAASTQSTPAAAFEDPVAGVRTDAADSSTDTGEIVEIGERAADPAGRSAKSRQERYNELLRAAPPAPPSANAQPIAEKQPSLFDRVIDPIASALGVNRARAAQPPQVVAAPPQQRPQQPPRQAEEAPREETPKREEPREEPDAETDTQAPQLGGAEFIPAQVQDDGETMFAAIVTDNLSGVRSVSGVIASPSGALQGFACQREGESDRWVARIKVPRDAAEGTWAVKYLTLSDHANNTASLNQNTGSLPAATFRVTSSGSDSTAPRLVGVQLDRNVMNAGDRNTIFIQAEDDKSGVSLVSGVFVSPSKQARIGFGCRTGAASWECVIAPPVCLDCGQWRLEQIQLQDKANNMATFRGENNNIVQGIVLDISGEKCDAGPPNLIGLSLSPPVVSNAEGGTIQIQAQVQDDACGVASLSGQAVPAGTAGGGQRIYFSFQPSQDGQNFVGQIVVPKHAAKGAWGIGWIQALDKGHNLKAYSASDPVVSRVSFQVE